MLLLTTIKWQCFSKYTSTHYILIFLHIFALFINQWNNWIEYNKTITSDSIQHVSWGLLTIGVSCKPKLLKLNKGFSQNQSPSVCWKNIYVPLIFYARKLIIEPNWRRHHTRGFSNPFLSFKLFFILSFVPKASIPLLEVTWDVSYFHSFLWCLYKLCHKFLYLYEMYFSETY